ncbi:MAG: hypothetical protein GX276_07375 [Clostridiaceae bacterium]|jgi:ligand-binding sensor protein|nr:hypothetical protein [Clostridiaceae bacterium]
MKKSFKHKPLIYIVFIGIIVFMITLDPFNLSSTLSVGHAYGNIYYEYENMNMDIKMKDKHEEYKNNLLKKVNEFNIDTEIFHDEIINELNAISKRNRIELSSIKFSEIMPCLSDKAGICMKVTTEFDSELNDMLNFTDDVKNSELMISVENVSALTIEKGIHASIDLMVYALPLMPGDVNEEVYQ